MKKLTLLLLAAALLLSALSACGDAGAPARLTPIRVRLLPAEDRLRLREGIPARDRRELAMLLEDLGS